MNETKKLLFFVFLLLFYKIRSESDCTTFTSIGECESEDGSKKNCRWLKISNEESKCLDCSEISEGESKYFSVKFTVDNEPYCHKVGKSGYAGSKLIFDRKQIVNSCKEFGLKTLGGFCYETCPENSELDNDVCKCKFLFYKEIKEDLTYINCLSEGTPCPNGYNYIYNDECIKACPAGKEKLEKENDNYLCVDSCSPGKKIYVTNSPLGKSITYCLDECPDEAKFYYGDNNCLEKCSKNDKDFYNSNYKCISHSNVGESDCGSNNYYFKISPEEYIFQCVNRGESTEPCQDPYPYKFIFEGKDHCLKSCDDTNIKFFDLKKTYLYEEGKQCLDIEQTLSSTNYFMIEKEKKFVSDCSTEEYWPYHDGKKCVPNCGSKYIKEDTNECVNDCESGYFKDEKTKICFKNKCPDHLGRGFYDNNKKCVECGIEGEEKGFHKENDAQCYAECPEGYKHNYNNNICFEGECQNTDYKFSYDGDAKTCYYSCKDIGDDYTIEKDFKCYKSTDSSFNDNNYYFYQTSYGLKKYIHKDTALSECFKNGLKYLRDNECVQQCNEEEYKVFPTYENFGICFESSDKCKEKNYKFYTKTKVCSKACEYYTILDNTGGTEVDDGNCHEECPSNYSFLEGTICKDKCSDNYCYLEENGIKKCSPKGNYFTMDIDGHFKCVKYCTNSLEGEDENKNPIFSYYDSNKNCRDTCLGNTGKEFSYEAINEHKECLSECSNVEYYYEDKKICLKKCDKYYKSNGSKICVEKCQNGEYIHPGNICSSDECPKEAPFFIKETVEDIEIKRCIFSCDNYYIYGTKECVESTPSSKSILYGGLIDSCPTGYSSDDDNKCSKPEDCDEKPFFLINENEHTCFECDGNRFLTSIGECVQKCPIGERFIKNGNKCSDSCDNKFKVKDNTGDYIIYECVEGCTPQKEIFGKKECVDNCEAYGLIEKDNICYSDCKSIDLFEKLDNGKKVCVNDCGGLFYNNKDKICENECSFHSTKIVNGNEKLCIVKCDNILQIKNNKLYCSTSCDDPENKRYLEVDNKCIPKCPNTHYVENGSTGKCIEISSCDKKLVKRGEEYFCEESCSVVGFTYSYQDSKYCIPNCDKEDYVIQDTHTCVKSCSSLNTDTSTDKYYFYEYIQSIDGNTYSENTCVTDCSVTNKPYTRKNDHCDTECDSNVLGDYYYIKDTKKCLEKESCDKIDGRLCLNSAESCESKYMDENKFCLSNCYYSTNKKFYYKNGVYTCTDEHNNKILENNVIKNECDDNSFYKDNQCVETCPKGWNFYKGESANKECLDDCPINDLPTFQYYQIETLSSTSMFKCQENCNSYAILDKNKNARLCLGEKCTSDYPYYTSDDTPKECFKECPTGFNYYYKPDSADENEFKCIIDSDSCPDNYILYQNTKKCIKKDECNLKHINVDTKECVLHCEEGQAFYEDSGIIYCSNNCNNIKENLHLDLNGKQCKDGVEDSNCNSNEKMGTENDIKKCDCENLYYNDISSGLKVCIDKNEINCTKQIEYPYLIKDTKQCSHECNGVLSLNGQICHTESNFKCPDNSEVKKNSKNINQCTCKYKYYHYETENSKEIYCLPAESKCPRNQTFNRELLIEETKECVEYCPYENQAKKYGKTCVNLCPILSVVVNDECFCQDKWYMNSNDEMVCTNQCPSDKPIIIDQTKECVETCKDTKFPVFYKNKCYLDCTNFPETNKIDNIKDIENIDDSDDNAKYKGYKLEHFYGKYGENVCYCKGAWFEDSANNNDGCNINEDSECDVYKDIYAYKYTVLPIKKCVTECPEEFPYSFNDKCFESCEEGNKLLGINEDDAKNGIMSSDNSKVCVCKNLWKYNEVDISKKDCLDTDECGNDFLLIVATNECYKGTVCREENPLLFNNKCYNKNNCPENTLYKEDSPKTCSCVNYYYIDSNDHNYIKCLPNDDKCPNDYPNLIISKNKCVENDNEELNNLYSFNKIYYNNCPTYTKYDEQKKECICDNLYRFWYQDDSGVLTCGLTQCTSEKSKYIGGTKECVSNCDGGLVEYNGICYNDCPELTIKNSDGVCELSPTNDSNNITAISQFINNNIVDLYASSKASEDNNEEKEDIIELVNLKSTIEFYGVNKNKDDKKSNHNNKAKRSSSLSYIDLGECLDQIYSTYNMDPEIDDVIILKYDLMETPKEYLINPVEYKFINSRNGQEIDASICPKNSIKISYPFFNIINQYNQNSRRNLETIMISIKNENDLNLLTEKYNIGKEINEKYPSVDSFNSKDGIYTDFCSALEINGKDLALEDRLNILLPHYSLCEQNCTYNHTDFEEERIYCDCSFKNEFDLNRGHQSSLEINENAVIQSQSGSTNFPVLKCLSVLGDGGRIKKNIAFYYMLIIIIIEIVFLCMLRVYEMTSFKSFFSHNLCENNLDESKVDIGLGVNIINNKDKTKISNKKYDDVVKTTQRALHNPPIKKNNDGTDEAGYEFIPDEFLFLYFNKMDKGVKKKVKKALIPFDIKKNTKVLLQKMENADYSNVKASGPFHEDQNVVEIIFDNGENDINIESINESILDTNNNLNEKNIITVNEKKKIEPKIYKRENLTNYIINNFDEIEEKKEDKKDDNINTNQNSLLDDIKLEQRLLTKEYDFAIRKQDNNFITVVLAEILDKIYIARSTIFLRKYDSMYLYLSLYALYHVILLNILAMFYDIKTIKNIWNKENYPGMGFYLGYGILVILIVWIIYIIFECLLSNKGKYNEILMIKYLNKIPKESKPQLITKRINSLLSKMKTKMIIYYIIQFALIIFFFIYLVVLCAVYTGTMNKIFTSYGIAILELIILKLIYGLVLGILRYYSIENQNSSMYNFALFMDTYLV